MLPIERLHAQPAGEQAIELLVDGRLDLLHVGDQGRLEEVDFVGQARAHLGPGLDPDLVRQGRQPLDVAGEPLVMLVCDLGQG